jgi:hypothetical protein
MKKIIFLPEIIRHSLVSMLGGFVVFGFPKKRKKEECIEIMRLTAQ